jgi:3'-5' exoribonuclease
VTTARRDADKPQDPKPAAEAEQIQAAAPNGHAFPAVFRVTHFAFRPDGEARYECTATLFHEQAALKVRWVARQPDLRLNGGAALARVQWLRHMATGDDGAVRVDRVVVLERPEREVNLFRTIPREWVRDRSLVQHGIALLDDMPADLNYLFNVIFWNGPRFGRFCTGPSSIRHHHAWECGNLAHSIEVALAMRRELSDPVLKSVTRPPDDEIDAPTLKAGDPAIAIFAALIHDAGKADEYVTTGRGRYAISDRGRLVGHKLTVVEWIAAAQTQMAGRISDRRVLELLHTVTAVQGAPEWLGIRRPETVGAAYLSMFDRVSGMANAS